MILGGSVFAAIAALMYFAHTEKDDKPYATATPIAKPAGHNDTRMFDASVIESLESTAQRVGSPKTTVDESGVESPFEETAAAITLPPEYDILTNPRQWIATWLDARRAGRWDEAMVLRNGMLEAGASIVPLLFQPLHSGDYETERDTIRLLRQIGGPRATAMALGRIMATPKEHLHYQGYLGAMKDFDNRVAAEWLVRELGRTTRQGTRETLLNMLAMMGGDQTVHAIEHGIRHASDPLHQRDLVTSLMIRSNPSGVGALTYVLTQGEFRLPRETAAYALAMIGSRDALLSIAEAAEYENDERFALALQYAESTYAQETLLELTLNTYWSTPVRTSAATGLSSHGGYRIPVAFANVVNEERNTEVSSAMTATLEEGKHHQTNTNDTDSDSRKTGRGELWF